MKINRKNNRREKCFVGLTNMNFFIVPLLSLFLIQRVDAIDCEAPGSLSCDEQALISFAQKGWTPPSSWYQGRDPCAGWVGVQCRKDVNRVDSLSISLFKGSIPPEVSDMAFLEKFELVDVGLSGSLPPQLSTLVRLQEFIVRMNALYLESSGSFPPQYYTWESLQTFQFYCPTYQPFSGSLPPDWSNWINIQFFEVSGCIKQDAGAKLPKEWSLFDQLTHLDLKDNSLIGKLPSGLSASSDLSYLDLSGNLLSSKIPSEFSAFTNLTYFRTTGNKLKGGISSGFSSLTNMEYFDMENNKLDGSMAKEFSTWKEIGFFLLSKNYFTGTLPPQWSIWSNISKFDIPYNLFSGTLPTTWATSWTRLRVFDISENKRLCGKIPNELLEIGGVQSILGTNIQGWCPGKLQPVSWILIALTTVAGLLIIGCCSFIFICAARRSQRRNQVRTERVRQRGRKSRTRAVDDGQGIYQEIDSEPIIPSIQQIQTPAPTGVTPPPLPPLSPEREDPKVETQASPEIVGIFDPPVVQSRVEPPARPPPVSKGKEAKGKKLAPIIFDPPASQSSNQPPPPPPPSGDSEPLPPVTPTV
eukprot:TRINITY_DN3012_c0_g1_i5.p1 TRINITY_DN3012_c0_g1~~TRINITY_DN3012_c0_g1_i5.p1  ORF type:complete len:599 (-),score=62.01 TRINITY_DN3012_c0_g1_i5:725-2479(-)